jgi:hypothetical protein
METAIPSNALRLGQDERALLALTLEPAPHPNPLPVKNGEREFARVARAPTKTGAVHR